METSTKNTLIYLKEAYDDHTAGNFPGAFMDIVPQIVFTYNIPDNKLICRNEKSLHSMLGYTPDDVIKWSDSLLSVVYYEDLGTAAEFLTKLYELREGAPYNFHCRCSHKSGKIKHILISAVILRADPAGRASLLLLTLEDDTQKAELEKQVSLLQAQQYNTEDLLGSGSWIWDIGTGKLSWSDGMYRLLDYKPENIAPGLSIDFYMKHIAAKDAQAFHDTISSAIKNKNNFECRYTLISNSGRYKEVLTKGKVSKDPNGKVTCLSGITCDITDLSKINNDLTSYKEMITEREYFLNQGSWETVLQTGETTWSRGMYHIFGYDTEKEIEDLKVTSTLHLSHLNAEEREKHLDNWMQVLKSQQNYVREASIITHQGEQKQVETYGKIIRDKEGIPVKVIGATRDVTSLNEYKKSLEEKINELNHRNTELEGFAHIASHDLQEPLRKLTAFSERLQTKFRYQLGEEGQLYLERIIASTENMRRLIDSLLEFSRTARSNRHFSKHPIGDLLQETLSDLELKIEESGTVIQASTLPSVEVIPSQIKQLFSNLLGNSIKFKQADQSPVITLACEKLSSAEKKSHNLKNGKEYYKLVITDNGIGFEKEYAERIFQIFQRLHGKHEYPGSGIGLAICKKIVDNHNGIIFADAEVNQSASFTIILPENQL